MSPLIPRNARSGPWPQSVALDIDGREIAVAVRINARARSYRLSLPASGKPVLTVPPYGRLAHAEAFLDSNRAWLGARLKRHGGPKPFCDGASVPLRGVPHTIVGTGAVRGRVETDQGNDEKGSPPRLLVPGGPEHVQRRLVDWFKAEAKADLDRRVAIHAENLDVRPAGLSLRGQSTRWGSCSSRKRLNFNWRLVLAPPFVLDYVAAHEVAHLIEMNHSPAFWATVTRTLPDMERGRAWLKAHGHELMGYGA